jgi:hypothetical protein
MTEYAIYIVSGPSSFIYSFLYLFLRKDRLMMSSNLCFSANVHETCYEHDTTRSHFIFVPYNFLPLVT